MGRLRRNLKKKPAVLAAGILWGASRLPKLSVDQNDRLFVTSQVRGSGILASAVDPSGSALTGISVEL